MSESAHSCYVQTGKFSLRVVHDLPDIFDLSAVQAKRV